MFRGGGKIQLQKEFVHQKTFKNPARMGKMDVGDEESQPPVRRGLWIHTRTEFALWLFHSSPNPLCLHFQGEIKTTE